MHCFICSILCYFPAELTFVSKYLLGNIPTAGPLTRLVKVILAYLVSRYTVLMTSSKWLLILRQVNLAGGFPDRTTDSATLSGHWMLPRGLAVWGCQLPPLLTGIL